MEGKPGRYEPLDGVDDCTLVTDEEINELQPLRPDKLVADQDTSMGCGWGEPQQAPDSGHAAVSDRRPEHARQW